MKCQLKPLGDVSNADVENRSVKVTYVCTFCDLPIQSRYPPKLVHRMCSGGNPHFIQLQQQLRGGGPPVDEATTRKVGFVKKLSRYAQALKRWTIAGKPVRSDEQVATIFAICQTCEHFNAERNKCKLCGCRLNIGKNARFNKIRMATENCPDEPARW